MNIMEIENLFKIYDKTVVLDNITLSLKRGTTLGLIGPTGGGKTTLLRIIDLLEKPSQGKIFFENVDTSKSEKTRMKIRRKIAMVFQKPIVFRGTVYDNIHYGLKIRGINSKASKKKIMDLLDSLGLEGYEHRDASKLSGGEIQRIALARAIITQPKLLLLDEPTANLDPNSTEKIEYMIQELREKEDMSIIISTHNLIQGQRLADEIAILNKKIYQVGKPEEIFRKPVNRFVADFVGVKNVISGTAKKQEDGLTLIKNPFITLYSSSPIDGTVYASIRPEDITISLEKVKTSALNELKGIVKGVTENGGLINLIIDCGELLNVVMTRKSFLDLQINIGTEVWVQFKASAVHLIQN